MSLALGDVVYLEGRSAAAFRRAAIILFIVSRGRSSASAPRWINRMTFFVLHSLYCTPLPSIPQTQPSSSLAQGHFGCLEYHLVTLWVLEYLAFDLGSGPSGTQRNPSVVGGLVAQPELWGVRRAAPASGGAGAGAALEGDGGAAVVAGCGCRFSPGPLHSPGSHAHLVQMARHRRSEPPDIL